MDKSGFAKALYEIGIAYDLLNRSTSNITLQTINNYPVIVISEITLNSSEISIIKNYVNEGGGIIITGKSGNGLEDVLGISSLHSKSTTGAEEIRFEVEHRVSHGCYWNGSCMNNPPMPASEIPTIAQFLYPESSWTAYSATINSGTVIAHWYANADTWGKGKQNPAIIVNTYNNSRALYSGALPGVYSDPNWQWPSVWRRFIVNAVEWVSRDEYLVEIGYWPAGYKAAFIWSGDTETADMKTAVPAILGIFDTFGLEKFGTFYVVGKKGGDAGSEGAQEHPEIVKMIVKNGSEVGGHGNIHSGFSGKTLTHNVNRLQEMVDINNAVIQPFGESCRGFRAPHVDFDINTLKACAQVGLLYESSDLDVWSETSFPFFNRIWEAPATMPMDWTLFKNAAVSDADAIRIYKNKFDYIYAKRAMFNWLCHPWVIDGHLNVLQDVLQHVIDKQDVWLVRQDRLIEWWAKRTKLCTKNVTLNGDVIDVTIQNNAQSIIKNAAIWLRMRQGLSTNDLVVKMGNNMLTAFPRQHNGQSFLVGIIPEIEAGAQVTVRYSAKQAGGIDNKKQRLLKSFKLEQNYPNPFNSETNIKISVNKSEFINLSIYNIQGKEVVTLVNERISAGQHTIVFNGNKFPTGIYFLKIKAKIFSDTKKMILIN